MLELFQTLKIANIRVLQKTKDALDRFEPRIKKRFPNLWPNFARQVVKLSCLHYVYGEIFPLDTLIKYSSMGDYHLEKSKDPEDQKLFERRAPVRMIGYRATDTDVVIVEFLSQGLVDWEKNEELFVAQERHYHLSDINIRHRVIWSMLWANFSAPEEAFVKAQQEFLEKYKNELSLSEIDQVAKSMRLFGGNAQIDQILEEKIAAFAAKAAGKSDHWDLFHNLTPETSSKVQELIARNVESKPILEAITMMTRPGGWNPSDIRYLANVTEDQFFEWLVAETAPDVLSNVKEFRSRFGGRPESDDVVERLDGALRRLAGRSKIDDVRVYSNIGLGRTKDVPAPEESSGEH
jgi:hypothetical protein